MHKKGLSKFSFSVSVSLLLTLSVVLPSMAQKYITTLRGNMHVVSTAKVGNSGLTVVTVQDRAPMCLQSIGTPREKACLQEARARGMLRTKWEVSCKDYSVKINNEYASNLVHQINPDVPPSRSVMSSYIVYDYACGTNYTR